MLVLGPVLYLVPTDAIGLTSGEEGGHLITRSYTAFTEVPNSGTQRGGGLFYYAAAVDLALFGLSQCNVLNTLIVTSQQSSAYVIIQDFNGLQGDVMNDNAQALYHEGTNRAI